MVCLQDQDSLGEITMPQTIDVVDSSHEEFPWKDYVELMRLPEVFAPQMEDGYPPVRKIDFEGYARSPFRRVWLFFDEGRSIGFVMLSRRGQRWEEGHLGFRRGISGQLKRAAVLGVIKIAFAGGTKKISAFIPSFNRPACHLVAACGFQREGAIYSAFLREGEMRDVIIFGVSSNGRTC